MPSILLQRVLIEHAREVFELGGFGGFGDESIIITSTTNEMRLCYAVLNKQINFVYGVIGYPAQNMGPAISKQDCALVPRLSWDRIDRFGALSSHKGS